MRKQMIKASLLGLFFLITAACGKLPDVDGIGSTGTPGTSDTVTSTTVAAVTHTYQGAGTTH